MRLIDSMLPRRPPSTLFETMKEFGLYDLPWIRPLECLEQNDFADRVLKVIAETSTELSFWAKNPFQHDNTNAPLAIGLIGTIYAEAILIRVKSPNLNLAGGQTRWLSVSFKVDNEIREERDR
ncbi:hypothetical protein EYR38_002006 [Pleurotus pulmonarius]|nr:hypothetical protein EYR38_002006 [Pleurotus pulmonarius]